MYRWLMQKMRGDWGEELFFSLASTPDPRSRAAYFSWRPFYLKALHRLPYKTPIWISLAGIVSNSLLSRENTELQIVASVRMYVSLFFRNKNSHKLVTNPLFNWCKCLDHWNSLFISEWRWCEAMCGNTKLNEDMIISVVIAILIIAN